MKKNSTVTIIFILLVLVVGILVYSASKPKMQNSLNNNPNSFVSQNDNISPQLFSGSPLSQNAYLISTTPYDANTQKALSGFTVTNKTLADGSREFTLTSTNPEYQTQTYTVKQGEKLYFIETMLGDDSNNQDRNLGDDTAVVVDANGYIVTQ